MWYIALVGLWVMRGGTMDTKPTDLPAAILPAPRTRDDVEADLALAGLELRHHRSRRGDTVNTQERLAQRPALLVHELNALLDEWATLNTPA